MKKLFISLIVTFFITNFSFGQNKISFLDIKGKEIAIIIDNNDNSFTEYYLFQYKNQDFSRLLNTIVDGTVKISGTDLIVSGKDQNYVFSFDKHDHTNSTVYFGYGLSHRKGNYKIVNNDNPQFIYDVIVAKVASGGGIGFGGDSVAITCHSGGPGSSACSVKASSIAVGTAECSVTCNTGYYSCCDDTKGECRCVEVKK